MLNGTIKQNLMPEPQRQGMGRPQHPQPPLPLPGGFEASETVLWKSSVRGETPGGALNHSFDIAPLPHIASLAHLHLNPGVPHFCALTTPHPK